MVHCTNCALTGAVSVGEILAICADDNQELPVRMVRVFEVTSCPYNIISLTKKMEDGWELHGNKEIGFQLSKHGIILRFNIRVETDEGVVWAAQFRRRNAVLAMTGTDMTRNGVRVMDMTTIHRKLGHADEQSNRNVAKRFGWETTDGPMMPCESCAVGKGRQKKCAQDVEGNASYIGLQNASGHTQWKAMQSCVASHGRLSTRMQNIGHVLHKTGHGGTHSGKTVPLEGIGYISKIHPSGQCGREQISTPLL
jgi:hypothetical protein